MNRTTLTLLVLPFFAQLINSSSQQNVISQTVDQFPDIEIISMSSLEKEPPTFNDLCKKIIFTKSGLICYFKHIYNCEMYAQEVLPIAPFQHLEEFLNHGIATKQPRSFTKAVIRLFDKKFDAVPSMSATEVLPFLRALPDLIQKDLIVEKTKKHQVKSLVRSELENNFDVLKVNPDLFLEQIADKIVGIDIDGTRTVSKEQLCDRVTRFIHTCLGKLMWLATDKDAVWQNFMDLGKELTNLKDKGIIRDTDDLDDCQWALTTRFCDFLTFQGAELPLSFYQKARADVSDGIKHLDELLEQEDQLATKRSYLQDALVQAAAQAETEHGILSKKAALTATQKN